ncbi:MAG: FG-GAP repeat protein [Planctomycetota bacterium JB042]
MSVPIPRLVLAAIPLALLADPAAEARVDKLEEQKLVAADAAAGDELGDAVAIDGPLAVLGAPNEDSFGSLSGAAYVLEEVGGVWSEVRKLVASDGAAGDGFGNAVAVADEVIAVAARFDDDAGSNSGAVYLFERQAGTFVQTQKLAASDAAANGGFGAAVALSGDTLLVGAVGDGANGFFAGAAYVFERQGGLFVETAKLLASDGQASDTFGLSAALDGGAALVGSFAGGPAGAKTGAAYVFEKSAGAWTETAKLTASDAAVPNEFFSFALALDGDLAVVGAPRKDGAAGARVGASYVFERQGGTFVEVAKLVPAGASANDESGRAVGLSGELVVVGSPFAGGAGIDRRGSATLFERQAGTFVEVATLAASDAGADAFGGDELGTAVALSGPVALVSAPRHDGAADQGGAAYVFDRRALPYGGGCPTSAGVVPAFHVRGHPEAPNPLRVEFAGGPASAVGVLFAGPTAGSFLVEGCELLIDPGALSAVAFVLDPNGALAADVVLPASAAGKAFVAQALLHDPNLAPTPAGTNGLTISID